MASSVDSICSVVERELFGLSTDAYSVERLAKLAASVNSARSFAERMHDCERMAHKGPNLERAIAACSLQGLVLEFGVHKGWSVNVIATRVPQPVFGFDVFYSGLPEDWPNVARRGEFSISELPAVEPNVELVVGLFEATLPGFVDTHPGCVRLLHVDCDLYSSTKTVFRYLGHKIVPGTVIVFDEYFNYPGWRRGEFRAFQEFIVWSGLRYEYLSVVPDHQQVTVVIME